MMLDQTNSSLINAQFSSCKCENIEDCTCSDYTAGPFGKCTNNYKSRPICYVNEPSNCSDLVFSKTQSRRYSWDACVNWEKGKPQFLSYSYYKNFFE